MQYNFAENSVEGPLRNLRSEDHVALKQANLAYTDCVAKSFMPRWLSGEGIQINEVCGAQYEDMMEKHGAIYEASPITSLKLPEAMI